MASQVLLFTFKNLNLPIRNTSQHFPTSISASWRVHRNVGDLPSWLTKSNLQCHWIWGETSFWTSRFFLSSLLGLGSCWCWCSAAGFPLGGRRCRHETLFFRKIFYGASALFRPWGLLGTLLRPGLASDVTSKPAFYPSGSSLAWEQAGFGAAPPLRLSSRPRPVARPPVSH